jgi:cytochrome P450
MAEMQLVLATLAQQWEFDTSDADDLGFAFSATVQPDRPVEMTVSRR